MNAARRPALLAEAGLSFCAYPSNLRTVGVFKLIAM